MMQLTDSITGAGHLVHLVHLLHPSRVFKGMKMAGQTGGDKVKVINLRVVKIIH